MKGRQDGREEGGMKLYTTVEEDLATSYDQLGGGDLGWCEVCEEAPATQQARFVPGVRICAACAEGEPNPSAV